MHSDVSNIGSRGRAHACLEALEGCALEVDSPGISERDTRADA